MGTDFGVGKVAAFGVLGAEVGEVVAEGVGEGAEHGVDAVVLRGFEVAVGEEDVLGVGTHPGKAAEAGDEADVEVDESGTQIAGFDEGDAGVEEIDVEEAKEPGEDADEGAEGNGAGEGVDVGDDGVQVLDVAEEGKEEHEIQKDDVAGDVEAAKLEKDKAEKAANEEGDEGVIDEDGQSDTGANAPDAEEGVVAPIIVIDDFFEDEIAKIDEEQSELDVEGISGDEEDVEGDAGEGEAEAVGNKGLDGEEFFVVDDNVGADGGKAVGKKIKIPIIADEKQADDRSTHGGVPEEDGVGGFVIAERDADEALGHNAVDSELLEVLADVEITTVVAPEALEVDMVGEGRGVRQGLAGGVDQAAEAAVDVGFECSSVGNIIAEGSEIVIDGVGDADVRVADGADLALVAALGGKRGTAAEDVIEGEIVDNGAVEEGAVVGVHSVLGTAEVDAVVLGGEDVAGGVDEDIVPLSAQGGKNAVDVAGMTGDVKADDRTTLDEYTTAVAGVGFGIVDTVCTYSRALADDMTLEVDAIKDSFSVLRCSERNDKCLLADVEGEDVGAGVERRDVDDREIIVESQTIALNLLGELAMYFGVASVVVVEEVSFDEEELTGVQADEAGAVEVEPVEVFGESGVVFDAGGRKEAGAALELGDGVAVSETATPSTLQGVERAGEKVRRRDGGSLYAGDAECTGFEPASPDFDVGAGVVADADEVEEGAFVIFFTLLGGEAVDGEASGDLLADAVPVVGEVAAVVVADVFDILNTYLAGDGEGSVVPGKHGVAEEEVVGEEADGNEHEAVEDKVIISKIDKTDANDEMDEQSGISADIAGGGVGKVILEAEATEDDGKENVGSNGDEGDGGGVEEKIQSADDDVHEPVADDDLGGLDVDEDERLEDPAEGEEKEDSDGESDEEGDGGFADEVNENSEIG